MEQNPAPEASIPPLDATQQRIDSVLVSVWRRLTKDGVGPELTISEASAILGISADSVRRRITSGQIPAYRDLKGRLRITPRLADASDELGPAIDQASLHVVARMVDDLKSARSRIERMVQENETLRRELDSASQALEHSRDEVTSMWRILSTRKPAAPGIKVRAPGGGKGVEKIQGKITAARQLAKRHKWPWGMVG